MRDLGRLICYFLDSQLKFPVKPGVVIVATPRCFVRGDMPVPITTEAGKLIL